MPRDLLEGSDLLEGYDSSSITKKYEDWVPTVYKDTKGKRSIGYGFNLDDPYTAQLIPRDVREGRRPLTKEEAEPIFKKRYEQAKSDARKFIGQDFDKLDKETQDVVTDMAYNMGYSTLSQFKKFKENLVKGDFANAAEEMKGSNWFTQVGRRSREHYEKIKSKAQKPLAMLENFLTPSAHANELEVAMRDEQAQKTQIAQMQQQQQQQEKEFQSWYAEIAEKNKLDPNPDDPRHFYDYRSYYKDLKAGITQPPEFKPEHNQYRMPDKYKLPGHPDYYTKQDPSTWTEEQTKKYMKEHPAQNPQEEIQQELLLEQKKQDKKIVKEGIAKQQAARDLLEDKITLPPKDLLEEEKKEEEFVELKYPWFMGGQTIKLPKKQVSNIETLKSFISQTTKQPLANVPLNQMIASGDQGVEEVSKFVEPEVPAGRTTAGLLIKDFPRQLSAEFIRSYKPSTLITAYVAGRAIKPIAEPIGRFIWRRVPDPIKKFLLKEFTVGKGQPMAYQEAASKAQLERVAGAREAEEVAKTLTTGPTGKLLTPEEQRYVGRIFRKETIENPALLRHPRYQELKTIADEGRVVMDKWSKALVDSGIPSKQAQEAIEGNVGKYMARMYTSKLQPQTGTFSLFKNLRLRLNSLKHRKDLSEAVLKELGEIKEPALPTAIRVKEISTSVANNKLFKIVAKNPEWTVPKDITGNMVKLAETKALGPLSNKWVIPEIAEDINSIVAVPNKAIQAYTKLLGAWKYGKVVLNPATHSRNILSNTMLLDLSGTNHLRQGQLFVPVVKDYLEKGSIYQKALQSGAIGGEFIGGEVARLKDSYLKTQGNHLDRVLGWLKVPFKKAGDLYQAEEQIGKMIKFTDVLSKGGTVEMAAKEAQKWLFNYNEIPNFIKYAKQASPFITFTYKSIPRIAEAVTENPLKVYKYYAFFRSWNEAARKSIGMSEEEYKKQEKNLPDWMLKSIGGMPTNLMMPWRDKYGKPQVLNLEYILPVGLAPEISEKGLLKGAFSNPGYQVLSDLQKNRDFRDKPIIPVGATPMEANRLTINYIYKQLAPSLAPALGLIKGGYSWEKLMDAIKKRPDFMGRVRELPQVTLDVLAGIKIQSIDTKENIRWNLKEKERNINDLKGQLRSILRNKGVSQEEKDIKKKAIIEKIRRIIKEK